VTTKLDAPVHRAIIILDDDDKPVPFVVAIDSRGVFMRRKGTHKWRAVSWRALDATVGEPGEHTPLALTSDAATTPIEDGEFHANVMDAKGEVGPKE